VLLLATSQHPFKKKASTHRKAATAAADMRCSDSKQLSKLLSGDLDWDQALSLLREAVDHGLPPYADLFMAKDLDLTSLHGDPRFDAVVAHAKERAAGAAHKPN
jgi:hypothetical protein